MLVDRVIEPLLALPRAAKRTIVMTVDVSLSILTVWIAFYLRLGEWVPLSAGGWPAAVLSLISLPIFVASGLYRTVFRHAGSAMLMAIAQSVLIYGVIYFSIITAFGISGVPRTVGIIQPLLLLGALVASRHLGQYWLAGRTRRHLRRSASRQNVLIYGAGSAGRQLAGALGTSLKVRPVGFIDDDPDLQGALIIGIRVWGSDRLSALCDELDVEEILLAMPSASRQRRNEILKLVQDLGVAVRTLPDILDIAHGKVTVSDLRPLEIDDLLGRDSVEPDALLLSRNLRGKCVLVTGAGGSIGSELCRQIMDGGPHTLLLVDSSEYALYAIHSELLAREPLEQHRTEIVPLLSSVLDRSRIAEILGTWRPETVFHAAAYKHVPLVEHNPIDGIRNNVLGTWTVASLAQEHRVANFVLISTDKAVRPTNVMGASKRMAELLLQALAADAASTCFCMVRFGNVLGSSGSVVPLFRKQVSAGGPVTVTHPDITRYFMTIPEAAQLVIQAGAMADGGEVFVLDMGDPIRVLDLARRIIELSGLKIRTEQGEGDIEIVFTGLRPGEKLYEELLIGDNPAPTQHPRVMKANEHFIALPAMSAHVRRLEQYVASRDLDGVLSLLREVVVDYRSPVDTVDWVASARKQVRADAAANGLDRPKAAASA